jgi:nucleotide-binding universal stress UspA family protein
MNPVKHILVPTDFEESADQALELALELAAKLDAKLTVMHAYALPPVGYATAIPWPITELESAARRALDGVLERARKKRPDVDGALVMGNPWDQVLDVAKQRGADLIVMGTHGRRGIARVLIGSTAEKVVRLSPIPVLTVSAAARAP